jgi:Uma2 family endonuclease
VPEVWVVDLKREAILVYQAPAPEGYTVSRTARRGEQIVPVTLPELALGVDEVLG